MIQVNIRAFIDRQRVSRLLRVLVFLFISCGLLLVSLQPVAAMNSHPRDKASNHKKAALPARAAALPPETYYQATDTGLSGDDSSTGPLSIGFSFDYFGNTYTEFYASTNGLVSFVSGSSVYSNTGIPNTATPNNFITPLWDDLVVTASGSYTVNGHVYYTTIGTAPNRQLVVQWTNIGFFSDSTPLGTFQVILNETSNEIQFQYRQLIGTGARTHGSSGTVGLENADGTDGVQFAYNTTSINNEQSIGFVPDGGGSYTVNPAASYQGILLGGCATPPHDIPIPTNPPDGGLGSTSPSFAWTMGGGGVVNSYTLYVSTNTSVTNSPTISQTGITTTSYNASGLADGTPYYWAVTATGDCSVETWSTTQTFTTPPVPNTLTATPLTGSQIALAWVDTNTGEDEYRVERSIDNGATWTEVAALPADTTSYDDSGLNCENVYTYRVRAYYSSGNFYSGYSNTASSTTANCPKPPCALLAVTRSANKIDLVWRNDCTTQTDFFIERSTDDGETWGVHVRTDRNHYYFADIELEHCTPYYYRMRSYRASDQTFSRYTDIAFATTKGCPTIPVGKAGGKFNHEKLSLKVPKGTLPEGSHLYVATADWSSAPSLSSGMRRLGPLYELRVSGPDDDVLSNFDPPMQICVEYSAADLAALSGSRGALFIGSSSGGKPWKLEYPSNTSGGQVCADVTHFSYYGPILAQLPATGFETSVGTPLGTPTANYFELHDWLGLNEPLQTAEVLQPAQEGGMRLDIPRLDVSSEIVGVPVDDAWNVTWLGNEVGWLEGSAFPTWAGNSVLTGHVYDSEGRPGPFEKLHTLGWGDRLTIHAWGEDHVYEVREVTQVEPHETDQVLTHEDDDWLTLVTCQGYDEDRDVYQLRTVVRAVRVE